MIVIEFNCRTIDRHANQFVIYSWVFLEISLIVENCADDASAFPHIDRQLSTLPIPNSQACIIALTAFYYDFFFISQVFDNAIVAAQEIISDSLSFLHRIALIFYSMQ